VSLPGGGEIATLREAGDFIIALPEREHSLDHWQVAMRLLIDAAEHGGIVMVADIAMRRALSHGQPRPAPAPRKKAVKQAGRQAWAMDILGLASMELPVEVLSLVCARVI
jgi:hypothetical protein